jgi:hypothetical protein
MKVFKATDFMTEPLEMECEKFGFPNLDAAGERQYENSHFASIEEAWDQIVKSVKAGISLAGRAVARQREALQVAEKLAADMCVEYEQAMSKYQAWKGDHDQ